MTIDDLLKQHSGIRLDIGCGEHKQPGFVGIDVRELEGVDIVHDITKFPWPLPDNSATVAMCSHLVEHIPPFYPDPRLLGLITLLLERGIISKEDVTDYIGETDPRPMFVRFMDEVWRVLKPGGEFAIVCPHGYSSGFLQDPTHCNAINENTWAYFDPEEPRTGGLLYNIYRPKPWRIKAISWSPDANIEVVLVKRNENDSNREIADANGFGRTETVFE